MYIMNAFIWSNNNHKETFLHFPNESLCWKFWDYIGYKALIQPSFATFENIHLFNLINLLLRQNSCINT